jgi:tRNA(fMet)-specific endonuclease VapC
MSYRYLLDTNILSDLIRNPQGQASQHLKRIKPQTICTSILVACELSFGAQKRNAPALSDRIASLLDRIPVLPLDLPAHQHYSTLRCTLEKQGTPIGSMDLLIAAHALSLNLTLVTHNTREFSRVPNLSLENWLN